MQTISIARTSVRVIHDFIGPPRICLRRFRRVRARIVTSLFFAFRGTVSRGDAGMRRKADGRISDRMSLAAEIESERRWDELFAKSYDILCEMAAEAIREDEAGLTQPLDPDEM